MKLANKLLISCFLLTFHISFGQRSNDKVKLDSSFTLKKRLQQDKLDIGQHGVFFNEKTNQVFNDFNTIQNLSLTDISNYQKQVILQDEHLIKIWTSRIPYKNILKIIEINSVYPIDTTEDGSRLKDTVIYNDFFIQLKDTTKNVQYQTIDRQGVSKYSIGKRQVSVNREMILVALFYVDNNNKIKQLFTKYNKPQ